MSQQGPGGYGGGGPHGPPGGYGGQPPGAGYPPGGGGYPPGGGAPPGGYGPPGYPPPGAAPPGYPAQPGYGAYPGGPPAGPPGAPQKKNKTLLWVGLGCGGLLLLSLAGGIAGYLYMRSQVSAVESAVAAASAAVAGQASGAPASTSTLTPACGQAVTCCKATMAKTAGPNAVAAERACDGIGLLSDDICVKQYEAYKRAATVVGVTCP